ncbi:MAG: dual specificity protein phosphatase family protein [Chloroflexi bacterium]|nr:dual specificity protein phosphatase family protein [Chloroflexota bacterium]
MDISQITDYLFVGAEPRREDAEEIAGHQVQLVISMVRSRPLKVFTETPFASLWLPSFDSFLTPISQMKLMQGVEAADAIIREGGRVLVHCQKGRHRSIIMAAAILIAQGYTADEAMALLRARRQVADPETWYVRRQIKRFEKVWQAKQEKRVRSIPS